MGFQAQSAAGIADLFAPIKLSTGRLHPHLIYGTAFKDERTKDLTDLALKTGFEGLDTANYPSAYGESATGEALEKAFKSGLKREDILIQTKFTPAWAHAEGKLPYQADQPLEAQVKESIEQSFKNLKVDFIDILMLHVPFHDEDDNMVAWKVFETYVPDRIGVLGVSNFALPAFEKLFAAATIKPEVVQNRFEHANGYDVALRGFLEQEGVIYQAFSVLKGCDELLASDLVTRFSKQFQVPNEVAFYMLVLGLGKKVSIVNGTTSEEHMQLDLQKTKELLTSSSVEAIKPYLGEFNQLLQAHSDKSRSV